MPLRRTSSLMLCAALVAGTVTARAQDRSGANPGANPDGGVPTSLSSIELVVMNGTHEPGGVADSLRGYLQLTRPPFSAFSRIQEVSRGTFALSEGVATSVAIPHRGTVQITPTSSLQGRRVSLAVTITMGGRTHQTQFSAVSGVPFFLAHSTGADSALILRFVPR
jgi:hypothetical protein